MTQREKNKIDEIFDTLGKMSEKQDQMHEHIQRVDRFIYGDQDNGVDGLVERQKKDEHRLDNLERDIELARAISKFTMQHIGKIIATVAVSIAAYFSAGNEKILNFLKTIFPY